MSVPINKKLAAEIASHISSALIDLSMCFDQSMLSSSKKMVDTNPAGTLDSCSGTQNEHKNT